jgi:hypothetical protein
MEYGGMGPRIYSKYPCSMVQKEKAFLLVWSFWWRVYFFLPRGNSVETLWWHTKRLVCEPGPSAKNI